jgi:hypothetical protein
MAGKSPRGALGLRCLPGADPCSDTHPRAASGSGPTVNPRIGQSVAAGRWPAPIRAAGLTPLRKASRPLSICTPSDTIEGIEAVTTEVLEAPTAAEVIARFDPDDRSACEISGLARIRSGEAQIRIDRYDWPDTTSAIGASLSIPSSEGGDLHFGDDDPAVNLRRLTALARCATAAEREYLATVDQLELEYPDERFA